MFRINTVSYQKAIDNSSSSACTVLIGKLLIKSQSTHHFFIFVLYKQTFVNFSVLSHSSLVQSSLSVWKIKPILFKINAIYFNKVIIKLFIEAKWA